MLGFLTSCLLVAYVSLLLPGIYVSGCPAQSVLLATSTHPPCKRSSQPMTDKQGGLALFLLNVCLVKICKFRSASRRSFVLFALMLCFDSVSVSSDVLLDNF